MIGYFEAIESLDFPYSQDLATYIILHSLHGGFNQFRIKFNMNGVSKTIAELYGMLITTKQNIPIAHKKDVSMVHKGNGFKKDGVVKKKQDKDNQFSYRNDDVSKAKPKMAAKVKCFYYDGIGHWKLNCLKYPKEKKSRASTLGIFVIDINLENSDSLVFDTGCVSHIISNVHELRRTRTLANGEVELHVGNGARVVTIVVGTYSLPLPSGLLLDLNNCYYVPAITKNIISIHVLDNEGFSIIIEKGCFSIYLNSMFYANDKKSNGLYYYYLDLDKDIIAIESKKHRSSDSNPTYLWHCHLSHINVKRIEKLHKVGF